MKIAGTQEGNVFTLSAPIPVDTFIGKRSLLAVNMETKEIQLRTAQGPRWTDFQTGLLADSRNDVKQRLGFTF